MGQEHTQRADDLLAHAMEVAGRAAALQVQASSCRLRGWCALYLGELAESLSRFREAARLYRRAGLEGIAIVAEGSASMVQIQGLDVEEGLRMAAEAQRRAMEAGFPVIAVYAGYELAQGLLHRGCLEEASLLVASLVTQDVVAVDADLRYPCVRVALAKGDPATARDLEREWMAHVQSLPGTPPFEWVLLDVEVLVANGLAADAVDVARHYLGMFGETDSPPGRGMIAHAAYLAIEAARRAGLPSEDGMLERVDAFLGEYAEALDEVALRSFYGISTPIAIALRAELHGEPSAELWRAAYDAAAHVGPGLALPVRLRLVQVLLGEGERDEARTALPELVADAKAMGMNGVLEDGVKLGRRHRIPVPGDDRPSRLDILTAREREVLDVLATGATNKAIAERLFISEKTISVHVTNVLAKLGVSNRTEAAAVARELTVID